MDTITIHTTGDAAEDLRTLIDRIREGDTPGNRELLATLENCLGLLEEEKTAK